MLIETCTHCRICGHTNLQPIMDLGNQALGSIFPHADDPSPPSAPLVIVKCDHCHLVQLLHTVDAGSLYTDNYGYRSGLNNTMISHLRSLVEEIENLVTFNPNDIVVDIGCNDATLLSCYTKPSIQKIGIDPSGPQFKEYYPPDVELIPQFFSKQSFNKKAKVVTSISMFYDLPNPMQFVQDVSDILDDNGGLWVMEQSYMPTMIERNSFDTICHEHLEYYCLSQIKWMCDRANLKIINVTFNDCNGGSFRIFITKQTNNIMYPIDQIKIDNILEQEQKWTSLTSYEPFVTRCNNEKQKLLTLLDFVRKNNKTVAIYGASTKGNTLLQWYDVSSSSIVGIAERNPRKYGHKTPGTSIPIYSEDQIRSMSPDYMLVLPWHFKTEFISRESTYLKNGGQLIFPLPTVTITRQRRTAAVFGASGQIGKYLVDLLRQQEYIVYELGRHNTPYNSYDQLYELLTILKPDEVYNLAAETDSLNSFKYPIETQYINGTFVAHLCDILHNHLPNTRFFQANSIELFKGHTNKQLTIDNIDFYPKTPYGLGKLQAFWNVRFQRENHHHFHVNGILSNVESKHRRESYVTMKIAKYLSTYKKTTTLQPLLIGDPNVQLDWIHAFDVAKAMYIIMQQDTPNDYFITSGTLHTIKDLTIRIAQQLDINGEWRQDDYYDIKTNTMIIKGNADIFKRPYNQPVCTYDNTPLVELGWNMTYTFDKLCSDLVATS